MLVYGIPEFRLPKDIVRREIEALEELGVTVVTNAVAGRSLTIDELLEEYQADGVIEIILQACHTYNIESHYVKETVTNQGKAYLMIETDYSQSDKGQIGTRLEAFLETIEK